MKNRRQTLKKVMLKLLLAISIVILPQTQAQEKNAGLENPLHEWGAGSRAFALGRAYVAVADDPSAVFWNPAGLEFVPQTSFTLFYSPLVVSGVSYDFLGFVYPTVNLGSIGFGYARIGVGDILLSDEDGVSTGTSNYDYSEIYISYAKKLFWGLTPGITFKVHRQALAQTGQENSAFGLDGGLMYRPNVVDGILSNFSLGFHIQHLVKPELSFSENDALNNKMTLGIMKGFPIGLTGKLNALLSYSQLQNGDGVIHSGAEYSFNNFGTLRLGFDRDAPAFGAGIRYNIVDIDYAFSNLSSEGAFGSSHRFSVTFNFGKTREEKIFAAESARIKREQELVENTKALERDNRIRNSLEQGETYLKNKQYFNASVEFQRVIQEDPFNAVAQSKFDSSQVMIQQEFQKRQNEAVAQAVDQEIAQKNQQQIDLYLERGRNSLLNKQYADALLQFNLGLEIRPDDVVFKDAVETTQRELSVEIRTLVQNARSQFREGNFSGALQVLGEAMLLSPGGDDPITQQLRDEINTLTRRIRLQQFTIRGLALLRSGEYQEAVTVFEEALKLDPTNESIRQFYDQTRLELGASREKMDSAAEAQYAEAMGHFLGGRNERALEIFKSLKARYPYNKKIQDAINVVEDRIKRSED